MGKKEEKKREKRGEFKKKKARFSVKLRLLELEKEFFSMV